MKRYANTLAAIFLLIHTAAAQDYTRDNKDYKTISWNDFFTRREQKPDLVVFDIRTDGERNDTAQNEALNLGRIRGALQVDFYQFDKYYAALLPYKDDTIYLYCSHSMRSRQLAKRLADSSFREVVSINGGISYLNLKGDGYFPLRHKYYETSLKYNLISPLVFAGKMADECVQLVDIRPDSIYYQTGGDEQDKSYGKMDGILHIDYSKIQQSVSLLDRQKEIILVDNYGDMSPDAANLLLQNGFKNVGVLLSGLRALRNSNPSAVRKYVHQKHPGISSAELYDLQKKEQVSLIDVRSEEEFNNRDTVARKNIGRLKGAVNIPLARLSYETLRPYLGNTIVIYDSRLTAPEVYRSVGRLQELGIKNILMLSGGISQINWEIANTDQYFLKELVESR